MIKLRSITSSDLNNFSYTFNKRGLYLISESSTELIEIMYGLKKFSGEYTFNQEDIKAKRNPARFSYITKDLELIDYLSVSENFDLICDDSNHMYNTVSYFSDLSILNKKCSELSLAESRFVLILTALLKKSHVLLLEDILDGLNNEEKAELLSILKTIGQEHLVILTSTDVSAQTSSKNILTYKSSNHDENNYEKLSIKEYHRPKVKLSKFFDKDKSNTSNKTILFMVILFTLITSLLGTNINNKTKEALKKVNTFNTFFTAEDIDTYNKYDDLEIVVDTQNLFSLYDILNLDIENYFNNEYYFETLPEDDYFWKIEQPLLMGNLPQNKDEVALGYHALYRLLEDKEDFESLDFEEALNETITLRVLNEERDFKIVGILNAFSRSEQEYLSIGSTDKYLHDEDIFFHKSFMEDIISKHPTLTNYTYKVYFEDFKSMLEFSDAGHVSESTILKYSPINIERMGFINKVFAGMGLVVSLILLFKFLQKQYVTVISKEKNLSQYTYYGYSKKEIRKGLVISKVKELALILFGVLLVVINILLVFEFLYRMNSIKVPYMRGNAVLIISSALLLTLFLLIYDFIQFYFIDIKSWNLKNSKDKYKPPLNIKRIITQTCFTFFYIFVILIPFNLNSYFKTIENTEVILKVNISKKDESFDDINHSRIPLHQKITDDVVYGEVLEDYNIYQENRLQKILNTNFLLCYGSANLNENEILVSEDFIYNILKKESSQNLIGTSIYLKDFDKEYVIKGILNHDLLLDKYVYDYVNTENYYNKNIVYFKEGVLQSEDPDYDFVIIDDISSLTLTEQWNLYDRLSESAPCTTTYLFDYIRSEGFYPFIKGVLLSIMTVILLIIYVFKYSKDYQLLLNNRKSLKEVVKEYLYEDVISLILSSLLMIIFINLLDIQSLSFSKISIQVLFSSLFILIMRLITKSFSYQKAVTIKKKNHYKSH